MNSELNALRELGDALRPPDDEPPLELRRRVLAGPAARRVRIRPRPMAALVGSLAMLVVATLLTVGSGSVTATRTPDRSITSADVLELAAHGVNNQPALAARPDQYIYTESVAVFLEMPRADGPMTFSPRTEVRQWRAVDGTREGLRQTRPLDDPDAAWQSTPLAGCVKSGDCAMFSSGSIDLPADADKTYEYLYQRLPDDATTGIDADERALSRAAQLLYLSQHSPAVQAVVFEAVGRIPGMRVRLDAADVMGRSGIGLVYTAGGSETELVFDAQTYRYLGVNRKLVWLQVWRGPDGTPLTTQMVSREALTRVAIVDGIGQH